MTWVRRTRAGLGDYKCVSVARESVGVVLGGTGGEAVKRSGTYFEYIKLQCGHLDVLRWAREHNCPWDERTYRLAANAEVRQWAVDHGCEVPSADV